MVIWIGSSQWDCCYILPSLFRTPPVSLSSTSIVEQDHVEKQKQFFLLIVLAVEASSLWWQQCQQWLTSSWREAALSIHIAVTHSVVSTGVFLPGPLWFFSISDLIYSYFLTIWVALYLLDKFLFFFSEQEAVSVALISSTWLIEFNRI